MSNAERKKTKKNNKTHTSHCTVLTSCVLQCSLRAALSHCLLSSLSVQGSVHFPLHSCSHTDLNCLLVQRSQDTGDSISRTSLSTCGNDWASPGRVTVPSTVTFTGRVSLCIFTFWCTGGRVQDRQGVRKVRIFVFVHLDSLSVFCD